MEEKSYLYQYPKVKKEVQLLPIHVDAGGLLRGRRRVGKEVIYVRNAGHGKRFNGHQQGRRIVERSNEQVPSEANHLTKAEITF